MIRIQGAFRTLALSTLVLFGLAAGARAQVLDGTWFKLKATTKGVTIYQDGTLKKQAGSATQYVNFEWVEDSYVAHIWSQVAPGVWNLVATTEPMTTEAGNPHHVYTDVEVTFEGEDGRWIRGWLTFCIWLKLDKQGDLKSANFTTLGGETVDGSLDGTHDYRGSLKVTGKKVNGNKLPFSPVK